MKVLSLFDGISCLHIALDRANIPVEEYYASEVDKHAIAVTKKNYPDTIHIGDVTKVSYKDGVLYTENGKYNVGKIDLIAGGSPCQNLSTAGNNKGLQGEKSSLFFEFVRIKNEVQPKYFLLENVRMSNKNKAIMDELMGVEGKAINSALVSYQLRNRFYWSNIPFDMPEDKHINFQDYKDTEFDEKLYITHTDHYHKRIENGIKGIRGIQKFYIASDKVHCVTTKRRCGGCTVVPANGWYRDMTKRELELAQTLPIGYTDILSYDLAHKCIGNGWTVDVIAHILKGIEV